MGDRKVPTAPYRSNTFGNQIEPHVIEIVGKATGQKFTVKSPSATGPDLVLDE